MGEKVRESASREIENKSSDISNVGTVFIAKNRQHSWTCFLFSSNDRLSDVSLQPLIYIRLWTPFVHVSFKFREAGVYNSPLKPSRKRCSLPIPNSLQLTPHKNLIEFHYSWTALDATLYFKKIICQPYMLYHISYEKTHAALPDIHPFNFLAIILIILQSDLLQFLCIRYGRGSFSRYLRIVQPVVI